MVKHILYPLLGLLLAAMPLLTSCKDDESEENTEFSDWQARNDAYFASIRTTALQAIREAKNAYGNDWADHCNWRAYLCYSLDESVAGAATDSIFVEILERGTGSGCPLSTDSVRVFFMGRLIPSESYPEGFVFSHSGQSSKREDIFNAKTSVPAALRPTGAVRGLGTALQKMHIGDFWRVYVPYALGYNSEERTGIPAYSTLIFDTQLVSYYRRGTSIDPWR